MSMTHTTPGSGGEAAIAREAAEADAYDDARADRRLAGWRRRTAPRRIAILPGYTSPGALTRLAHLVEQS